MRKLLNTQPQRDRFDRLIIRRSDNNHPELWPHYEANIQSGLDAREKKAYAETVKKVI